MPVAVIPRIDADPTPASIRLRGPVLLESSQRRPLTVPKKLGRIDEIENKVVLGCGGNGGQVTAFSPRQLVGLGPSYPIGRSHGFVPMAVPSCGCLPAGPARVFVA